MTKFKGLGVCQACEAGGLKTVDVWSFLSASFCFCFEDWSAKKYPV